MRSQRSFFGGAGGMRRTVARAALVALLAAARPAAADDHWYGWQPIVADSIGTACLVASLKAQSPQGSLVCSASFLVVSPVIHAAHGQYGDAALSFGLRAAPIGVAVAIANHGKLDAVITAAFVGVALEIAALVIDYSVLSHEPGDPPAMLLHVGRSF